LLGLLLELFQGHGLHPRCHIFEQLGDYFIPKLPKQRHPVNCPVNLAAKNWLYNQLPPVAMAKIKWPWPLFQALAAAIGAAITIAIRVNSNFGDVYEIVFALTQKAPVDE
jgi:hypothetical protein